MDFIGNQISGRNRAEYVNDHGTISLGIFPSKAAYPKGTVVKLDPATGKYDADLGATDIPFGTVNTPSKVVDGTPVVVTGFAMVAVAKTTTPVAPGDLVKSGGFDTTDKVSKVTKATSGVIIGIVLEGGVVDGLVRVGYLLSPVKL